MITCFDNLIGVKELCTSDPDSGLYINDLPYLDLKVLDAIRSSDFYGKSFFDNKIRYAGNMLVNTINNHLRPQYINRTILEKQTVGYYDAQQPFIAAQALYTGLEIRIEARANLEISISKIKLFTTFTGTMPVKVFNLVTGQLLDTFNVTATANRISELAVYKKYYTENQRLYLGFFYDATAVSGYQSNVLQGSGFDCWDYCECGGINTAFVRGVTAPIEASVVRDELTGTGNTAGMSIDYTVTCSMESYVCSLRPELAFGFLHLVGSLICDEALNSKRLNSITTVDREKLEYCRDYCKGIYNDSLEQLFQNMTLPNDGCFRCNAPLQRKTLIP
jgi:hypothetical protein